MSATGSSSTTRRSSQDLRPARLPHEHAECRQYWGMTARRVGLATLIAALFAAAGTAWAAFEQEPGSPYPTGAETYAVYSADLNVDGRPDPAVLNGSSSTIQFSLRQAGGGFAEEAGSPV